MYKYTKCISKKKIYRYKMYNYKKCIVIKNV